MRRLGWVAALCVGTSALAETQWNPTVQLTAEERYDDGALLVLGGETSGQLMTKVSPQVGLANENPTWRSSARYAVDAMMRHGSGRNTLDHRGELTTRGELSRRLDFTGRARVWRVTDPTSLPRLGLARSMTEILYGIADASLKLDATERTELKLGYRFEGAQVNEGLRLPGVMHSPYAESWYALSRRTAVGAEYRFQAFSYGAERSDAHGGTLGLRHQLSRITTATLRGGVVGYMDRGAAERVTLPRASMELATHTERLELAFTVGQDLVGASGFASALWASFASGVVRLRATGPMTLFGSASWFRNGRATQPGLYPWEGGQAEVARGYAFGAGVEWKLTPNFSAVGAFDRFAQYGGLADGEALERNVAALRLVLTAL
jgi:hypothetical protein